MHFADSIVIFVLALILFGPKKLPEIGKQIGKLLVEFRRASNEFKAQIDEELRTMEQQERQKKLEQAAGQTTPALEASTTMAGPAILPPSTGTPVATNDPFGAVMSTEMPPVATAQPHMTLTVHPPAGSAQPEAAANPQPVDETFHHAGSDQVNGAADATPTHESPAEAGGTQATTSHG